MDGPLDAGEAARLAALAPADVPADALGLGFRITDPVRFLTRLRADLDGHAGSALQRLAADRARRLLSSTPDAP